MTPTLGRQLVLEIAPSPAFGDEDFLVAPCNEAAFALIEAWPDWPSRTLLLIGPPGSGKSHLGAIWARRAGAAVLPARELRADALSIPDRPLLLDDADTSADQAALFHLINLAHERGTDLLLTARKTADLWGLTLPDLLSRLRRAPQAQLGVPDDGLVRAVLVKLLVERQVIVDTSIVEFIARRIDRSLEAAADFVRILDREALSTRRRISRTLASEILAKIMGDAPGPTA